MKRSLSYTFVALCAVTLANAGVCNPLIYGLDAQRTGATAVFVEADGELEAVHMSDRGETANPWRELTAVTIQADLRQPHEPENPGQDFRSYISGLRDDSLLAVSGQQPGLVTGSSHDWCLLCQPGAPAQRNETLADLTPEPFDPAVYAAALPDAEPPDSAAPVSASIGPQLPGGMRLAAFVLPPAMPKRNALFFFGCGGFLILVVRLRRLVRVSKNH